MAFLPIFGGQVHKAKTFIVVLKILHPKLPKKLAFAIRECKNWTWARFFEILNAKKCSLTLCVHAASMTLLALLGFINAGVRLVKTSLQSVLVRPTNDTSELTDHQLQMSQYGYQHVFVTDISLFNVHSLF